AELGPLGRRGRTVLLALDADALAGAEVDGDLHLALPVGPRTVDLLDEQQARAQQGQADRHDHDEGHGHGEVPAQADPDLLENELCTHTRWSLAVLLRVACPGPVPATLPPPPGSGTSVRLALHAARLVPDHLALPEFD